LDSKRGSEKSQRICGRRNGAVITATPKIKNGGSMMERISSNDAETATKAATEANIVINGVTLTSAQSMTIRVALEAYSMDLSHGGLGDDGHGKTMAAAYKARISEIRKALYK
jgi:hypothetical protein